MSSIERLSKMKSEQVPAAPPGCNCRDHPCPLQTNDCQTDHVIYRATVTDQNQNVNTYTGLTGYTFKKRYDGHTYSFRHRGEKSTTLSSHLWDLTDKNIQYNLNWELVDRAQEFNPSTRKCRLCNKEKYYIIFQPEGATLWLSGHKQIHHYSPQWKRTLERWKLMNICMYPQTKQQTFIK